MNRTKRLIATALCASMALSTCSCSKKFENNVIDAADKLGGYIVDRNYNKLEKMTEDGDDDIEDIFFISRKNIEQYDLRPDEEDIELAEEEEEPRLVDNQHFLHALVMLMVCIGLGTFLVADLKTLDITVPVYFGGMIFALIVRNVADHFNIIIPIREIVTLGIICLSMFLAMAMMEMKLWQLSDLAAFMIITLLLQTAIVALFAYFVIFRATGSNYDAAAYTTASCGFLLGATPNAMANMDALFEEHGKAPTAYFVVPLVGSVFVDFVNTGVLTAFLALL